MYAMRKLKPDRSFTGALPPMIVTTLFFLTMAVFGLRPAFHVLALCFGLLAVLSLLMYVRLRSTATWSERCIWPLPC